MTLILRRLDGPMWFALGGAGVCRVGLTEIVGIFGSGAVVRVVFLGGKW